MDDEILRNVDVMSKEGNQEYLPIDRKVMLIDREGGCRAVIIGVLKLSDDDYRYAVKKENGEISQNHVADDFITRFKKI